MSHLSIFRADIQQNSVHQSNQQLFLQCMCSSVILAKRLSHAKKKKIQNQGQINGQTENKGLYHIGEIKFFLIHHI